MLYVSCIPFRKNPQSPRYRLFDIYTLAIPLPNSSPPPHTYTHTKKETLQKKTHYRKKSRNTILTILRNNTTTNLLWSSIERQNCLSTVLPWGVNVLSPSNSRQSRSQPLPQRVGWRCVTRRKRRTPVAGARAARGHFKASQSIRFEVDPITFANGAPSSLGRRRAADTSNAIRLRVSGVNDSQPRNPYFIETIETNHETLTSVSFNFCPVFFVPSPFLSFFFLFFVRNCFTYSVWR